MAHQHTKDDPRIFVFGSNLRGIHGAGAAAYAHRELGAEWGVGEGPLCAELGGPGGTSRSYALPTCRVPGEPLHLDDVRARVLIFCAHACLVQEDEKARHVPNAERTRFFVSAVGCGIAGFRGGEIAPLFASAPSNCDLPPGWRR